MEFVLGLFGFVVGLAFLAALVGYALLPIVAYVRSRHVGELSRRVAVLEDRLRTLRARVVALEAGPREAEATPPVSAELLPEARPAPPEPAPPPPLPDRRERRLPATAGGWEALLGGRVLGWAAVALFVLAAGFFLQVAFANGWIGPLGQVTVGLAVGVGLCAGGVRLFRRGARLGGRMLLGTGIIVVYLATFAAFGFYELLSPTAGGLALAVLMAETALLAVAVDSAGVAFLAVAGGLLTPLLIRSDTDQYISFFAYLLVLNAAVVGLATLRPWPGPRAFALVGTEAIFLAWLSTNDHPEKHPAALTFQGLLFAVYLADALRAARVRPVVSLREPPWRHAAGWEDVALLLLNAFWPFGIAITLLAEDYRPWLGSVTLVWAAVHAAVALLFDRRSPPDPARTLAAVAVALGLAAAAVPLEAHTTWVSVGWAAQGLALWWFGLRVRNVLFRLAGLALGVVAFLDCLVANVFLFRLGWSAGPLINAQTLAALAVAGLVVGYALAARRFADRLTALGRFVRDAVGLAGLGLLWLTLTREVYDYFGLGYRDWRVAQAAVSTLWATYAAALLGVGFAFGRAAIRWAALTLFLVTVVKVLLVDLGGADGIVRVFAFVAVAVVLAGAAWGYQRFGPARSAGEEVRP